jgi:flagellar hook-basal body complex protein FliE
MTDLRPVAPKTILDPQFFKKSGVADPAEVNETFRNILQKALHEVNQAQHKADDAVRRLATGETDNVHQVMVALEEANISLQFSLQVRNKVIEAYQEIMRMQV